MLVLFKMRSILLILSVYVLAAANSEASLVEEAAPLLARIAALPLDLQRTRSSVSLGTALGTPNTSGIKELESSILHELGQRIRQELENILHELEKLVGDEAGKLKELFDLLKGQPTKENADTFVTQLEKHLEVQDDVGGAVGLALDRNALAVNAWNAIETRGIADWWEKIKQWFSGLGSWISDKYDVFKDWAKDVFDKAIDASKPKLEQIKALAIEFLKNNWDKMSTALVKQALSFFSPYAAELGEKIWGQLIELARQHGLIPWEQTTPLYLH